MADPTRNQSVGDDASELAAAARDRGMEQLEGAKGQLAEGAERVAAAVERTADELEGDGDETVSGFGRSLAGLMRQLAGGLRERDIEQFAGELGELARRNPGVFLAGSVALGFGVARFFKARPQRSSGYDYRDYDRYSRADGYDRSEGRQSSASQRDDFDGDESLDLSRNPPGVRRGDAAGDTRVASNDGSEAQSPPQAAAAQGEDERSAKSRSRQKTKTQRASASNDAADAPATSGGKEP
jgi:hypothetical protein